LNIKEAITIDAFIGTKFSHNADLTDSEYFDILFDGHDNALYLLKDENLNENSAYVEKKFNALRMATKQSRSTLTILDLTLLTIHTGCYMMDKREMVSEINQKYNKKLTTFDEVICNITYYVNLTKDDFNKIKIDQ
jgi:hypothetical protein